MCLSVPVVNQLCVFVDPVQGCRMLSSFNHLAAWSTRQQEPFKGCTVVCCETV